MRNIKAYQLFEANFMDRACINKMVYELEDLIRFELEDVTTIENINFVFFVADYTDSTGTFYFDCIDHDIGILIRDVRLGCFFVSDLDEVINRIKDYLSLCEIKNEFSISYGYARKNKSGDLIADWIRININFKRYQSKRYR